MSLDFSIRGPRFDLPRWREEFKSILRGEKGHAFLPVTTRLFAGHELVDLADPPVDMASARCLPEGGILGVLVVQKENRVDLTLNSFISRADAALACDLLAAGLAAGGEISGEDGLANGDLKNAVPDAMVSSSWRVDLAVTRNHTEREGDISLPVGGAFMLKLTPEQTKLPQVELETLLIGQADRFGRAHPAKLFKLTREDKSELIFSNYSHIPTLLRKEIAGVTLTGKYGELANDPIPAECFWKAFEGRLEDAGNSWYVPEVNFPEEPALLETLGVSLPPQKLTEEEARQLIEAPMVVCMLIAGADGQVDEKELGAFQQLVKQAAENPEASGLFGHALRALAPRSREILHSVAHRGVSLPEQLASTTWILEHRLTLEGGRNFKASLFGLAKTIAEASGGGGGWFRRQPKIGEEEAKTLETLAKMLGVKG